MNKLDKLDKLTLSMKLMSISYMLFYFVQNLSKGILYERIKHIFLCPAFWTNGQIGHPYLLNMRAEKSKYVDFKHFQVKK